MSKKQLTKFQVMEQEARKGYIERKKSETSLREIVMSNEMSVGIVSISLFFILLFISMFAHGLWNGNDLTVKVSATCIVLTGFLAFSPFLHPFIKKYVRINKEAQQLSIKQVILEFQRGRITDAQNAAIGPGTTYFVEKKKSEEFLKKLVSVRDQLAQIIAADPKNDILSRVLKDVEAKAKVLSEVRRKQIQFETRVRKFVAQRLSMVEQLEGSLHKLELVREARRLCDQTDEVVSNIELSMTQSLVSFETRFVEMQGQIRQAYEESGIALAIDVSGQNDSFDLVRLENTIQQHIPAKLEGEKKVS